MKPKDSTIDRNSNGGDAGVTDKRNAILTKLGKIHQAGVPVPDDKRAVGPQKPQ